jgi:hypothetical protein
MEDQGLDTHPHVAPPSEQIPSPEKTLLPWWWSPVLIVIIISGIWLAVALLGSNDSEEPLTALPGEFPAEYANDTSLVIYGPGFSEASFFVGSDAALDPDAPAWFQMELARDTSVVLYGPGFSEANFFVGGDANLDPEPPAWFQIEMSRDTSLVTYAEDMPTFWVGTSGDIAPEK